MATTTIRKIVSQKKRRFDSEGFNLDLSYVTERVIAMGYPASEYIEAMYRNSPEDVRRYMCGTLHALLISREY
jgi:phosphatidylinositol-3,4,5-trisphosphate 3-phosphatase/dual-specificity protein phosphatase PTEN